MSSLAALQTTEAVVSGSNPTSLTVEKTLRTGRVTVYTVKISGQKGKPPPGANKNVNPYPFTLSHQSS